jgi:hypothetical protein
LTGLFFSNAGIYGALDSLDSLWNRLAAAAFHEAAIDQCDSLGMGMGMGIG